MVAATPGETQVGIYSLQFHLFDTQLCGNHLQYSTVQYTTEYLRSTFDH